MEVFDIEGWEAGGLEEDTVWGWDRHAGWDVRRGSS